jgi:uncharacterized membrane protein YkvA (DUF1232 family)
MSNDTPDTDKLVIELDKEDLAHLKEVFLQARMDPAQCDQGDILRACHELLDNARTAGPPAFILRRLEGLQQLVNMVEDEDWTLPPEDVSRVINALAYFANPHDLIPDDVPGLGFLDDAVMVDLVRRELAHEIKAYQSFCEFREAEVARRCEAGDTSKVTRADWLDEQRRRLGKAREAERGWLPFKRKVKSFLDS